MRADACVSVSAERSHSVATQLPAWSKSYHSCLRNLLTANTHKGSHDKLKRKMARTAHVTRLNKCCDSNDVGGVYKWPHIVSTLFHIEDTLVTANRSFTSFILTTSANTTIGTVIAANVNPSTYDCSTPGPQGGRRSEMKTSITRYKLTLGEEDATTNPTRWTN